MSKSGPVYLIDASAFIFRAYYALAPLSSKGRPSHAVAGFASMLLKLLKEKKPKACVVVFDSKKPSFRKTIFPEYKANREVPPPDLSGQIVAAMEMCRKAGFPILQDEGYEADDWIASFVTSSFPKEKVVIISSDKDLAQLVNNRVSMYDSFRDRMMGPKEVVGKWGVEPEQMGDFLSITGDSSDNIPGIPGFGPKTASKLLGEYKNIGGIYKNLEQLPPKQQEKLKEQKKQLELSRRLVALKDDLKVPFKKLPEIPQKFPKELLEFLRDWDLTRIVKQYADELGLPSADAAGAISESSTKFKLVQNQKDLAKLKEEVKKAGSFSFDCETNSFNRDEAKVVGVSFCAQPKTAWYVPWNHGQVELSAKEMEKYLREFLENKDYAKTAHNAKYDIQVLSHHGIHVNHLQDDTMVLGYLLFADRRSFSLENMSIDFLNEQKGNLKKLLDGAENFSNVELNQATQYAAQDSALTIKLRDQLKPKLEADQPLLWLYENIEIPLVGVLAEMETQGVLLDVKQLRRLSKDMHEKLQKIEAQVYQLAGHEFNIASPKQLQVVLFDEIGLEPIKKTKTGYSTNEAVLTQLSLEHEIPRLILEQRKLAKLTSTYIDVLPDMIAKSDGRLHTHYHQTGTATGRLSSSNPNLQNIPIRTEEGKKIREAFIPAEGFCFLSADYSQVELRLMAHFSKDGRMIEAFQKGRDIHSETAKHIFGTDESEFRSRAKAINFGIIYGISAFGLSQQLGISNSDAKNFIDSYFQEFPRVKEYMQASVKEVQQKLYSETLFGRKRPLPDIKSKNPVLRQLAERMAINAPLQGTAADIMKWAMVRVYEEMKKKKMKSRILLQVHDELVLEAHESELDELKNLVQEAMVNLKSTPGEKLKVPLVVDLSVGQNWAEL